MTTISETVSSGPFKFISQGAIVQEWLVGGNNIVLGFHDPAEYAKSNPAYFGATIGRYAFALALIQFPLQISPCIVMIFQGLASRTF